MSCISILLRKPNNEQNNIVVFPYRCSFRLQPLEQRDPLDMTLSPCRKTLYHTCRDCGHVLRPWPRRRPRQRAKAAGSVAIVDRAATRDASSSTERRSFGRDVGRAPISNGHPVGSAGDKVRTPIRIEGIDTA